MVPGFDCDVVPCGSDIRYDRKIRWNGISSISVDDFDVELFFFFYYPPVSTRVPRCKESFISVGEWCFSFHLQGASFPKSQEICNEIGGEMVVLDSEEKENMLTEYMEGKYRLWY